MPPPPRDLWARTAAAIESQSRFRDRGARSAGWRNRRALAPSALLAAALVVAVAVGTLTSSQGSLDDGATGPSNVALGTPITTAATGGGGAGATPIPANRRIVYLAPDDAGQLVLKVRTVDEVCPPDATEPCATDSLVENHPVSLDQHASTVIGSADGRRLIVVSDPTSTNGGSVSVVSIASTPPDVTPEPASSPSVLVASPDLPPSIGPSVRPSQAPPSVSPRPSASPSPPATGSPSPSVEVTPSPSGSIEIAHDVALVGQSAAYSASGGWFAFTARPVDGSAGPDIYAWKVGDQRASRVTDDHRSIFGSWAGDIMIGSTVVTKTTGSGAGASTVFEPASFALDPASSEQTALPQTGRAWRPAVNPRGRLAVYWTGTVRSTDVPGFAPDAGRLVLGDWDSTTITPSGEPVPTSLNGDQVTLRHETTIEAGQIDDWDARWDATGTHLAIWIADRQNPAIGRLSLYAVDSFDGRIDLKKPLLDANPAAAGYSIADGKLVWAEPATDGHARIQLLAWTDDGVGTVATDTGQVIVIR